MRAASSFDEFSRLREVVVGTATNAQIPTSGHISEWLTLFGESGAEDMATVTRGRFSDEIIEETNEDLDAVSSTLESLGVLVHRTDPLDQQARFGAPGWTSDGFYTYCPRDLTLIVGDAIIETPSPMRARYFETFGLRRILTGYMRAGSPFISAPKPRLPDELYSVDDDGLPHLEEGEPAFEAANVIRCGRDLFYQVSCTGNELGLVWLRNLLSALGGFRVHPVRGVYDFMHIDSTIVLVRPGLVLLNPERVTEDTVPEPFRRWDVIWAPPMTDGSDPPHPLGSSWIGMNILMVDPATAIVDSEQPGLIRLLESRHVDVIPQRLRHARLLGGGFHCVTLDTVRDGSLESYFD